eukprot:GDKJ01021978.1.p1 GENE.GDKJ01021978.1~~GDKJ01021978.1.p1  ORF type:complete len:412 (+),score=50.84 GDKJ01021978.1:142-1377(+)
MRLYVISDVHVEYTQNLRWISTISENEHYADVLIVAGDLSESLVVLMSSLRLFREKFGYVFFVPGNHDLWITRNKFSQNGENTDSVSKIKTLIELCEQEGIFVSPRKLLWERIEGDGSVSIQGELAICPIWSWPHATWDCEPRLSIDKQPPYHQIMMDFKACKWPTDVDPNPAQPSDLHDAEKRGENLSRYIDSINDLVCDRATRLPDEGPSAAAGRGVEVFANMKQVEEFSRKVRESGEKNNEYYRQSVTFSHFLPCIELIPEKRFLFFHELAKACGSDFLKERVKSISPQMHIFGHTHFGWDSYTQEIKDTRFVQACLGYPKERERRLHSMRTGEAFPPGVCTNEAEEEGEAAAPPVLVCVWEDGEWTPTMKTYWSDFYNKNQRDPLNEQLPWYLTTPGVPGVIQGIDL